ncbi:hypothetical protein ACFLS9_00490 [Bacteroidota bacterium]
MKKSNYLFFASLYFFFSSVTDCNNKISENQSEAIKFKTFIYVDKQGTGIEAFRILIPSNWEFDGEINWLLDNPSMPAVASFRVYNIDGKEEFEVFPNQPFFWTNNQMLLSMFPVGSRYFGNEVHSPVSPLEALKNIVIPRFRNHVNNFKITKEEHLPELAESLGAGMQSQPGVFSTADGAKISVNYEVNRVEMEEELYGVVEQISFPIQTMYGTATNTI